MFITCDIACHRMCVACGLHVFRMSSHVSCMWITCVSYVIACVLHAAYMRFTHYVTCIQIGTALLDFILVAPESQDMFINAGYPPCVTLAAAFFSSNPYSTPDPPVHRLVGRLLS